MVAFLDGTKWTVSVKREGVDGAGGSAGFDAYVGSDCRGVEGERGDGAESVSAAA